MHCCATKIHFSSFLPLLCIISLFKQCVEENPIPDPAPIPSKEVDNIMEEPSREVIEKTPDCEARIESHKPIDTSELERYRRALPHIVIDTKTTPVQYLRKPKLTDEPVAREIADTLGRKAHLTQYIRKLISKHRDDKSLLRRIFLREGYFFDDRPRVARQMVREIMLTDLFSAPRIFRFRKNRVETLTLSDGQYLGEDRKRARLLINDRVATSVKALQPLLHLDMEVIKDKTGARRTILDKSFEDAASINLVFPGGEQRPALVQLIDNRTHIECIGGDTRTLETTISTAKKFWEKHNIIIETAKKIVAERPIFDEPTDELEGVQEDGELRQAWKKAYRNRKKKFLYREVEYDVFDRRGNPTPPQVCVDFIVDTWERAYGTWYSKKGNPPTRTEGRIDFYALENVSRRYISSILGHALQEGSPFLRYDIPRRDWAPLEERWRYVRKLAKHANHYREGDLLVIHGLREEDMQEHYHTVLILETDLITGLPELIADNQGRPRITTLIRAMRAAPKRSVKYRIRLDVEKLAALTHQYREKKRLEAENSASE